MKQFIGAVVVVLVGCGGGGGGSGLGGAAGASGAAGAGASGGSGGSAASGGSGASGGSAASGGSGGSATTCSEEPEHTGEGTYYDADGTGNCSFDASPDDMLVGAMNQTDYQGSAACGRCAEASGPNGSVTVRIVDRCPECKPGDIDFSPQAFERIAEMRAGRVPITWRYVPCEVPNTISYRYKEGSSQWWVGIQVRGHRHGIARFEAAEGDGPLREVPRENYNYFVATSGLGPGPFTFRLTDVYGHQVVHHNVPLVDATVVPGGEQLPVCE